MYHTYKNLVNVYGNKTISQVVKTRVEIKFVKSFWKNVIMPLNCLHAANSPPTYPFFSTLCTSPLIILDTVLIICLCTPQNM